MGRKPGARGAAAAVTRAEEVDGESTEARPEVGRGRVARAGGGRGARRVATGVCPASGVGLCAAGVSPRRTERSELSHGCIPLGVPWLADQHHATGCLRLGRLRRGGGDSAHHRGRWQSHRDGRGADRCGQHSAQEHRREVLGQEGARPPQRAGQPGEQSEGGAESEPARQRQSHPRENCHEDLVRPTTRGRPALAADL